MAIAPLRACGLLCGLPPRIVEQVRRQGYPVNDRADVRFDLVAVAHHGREFHDVFKFSNVARKIMVADQTQGFGTDSGDVFLEAAGIVSKKMVQQKAQVFAPLLESGQVQADGGNAVEKVLAQTAFLDQFFRRFGGGGHKSDIDPHWLFRTNRQNCAFVQEAYKPALLRQG